MLLDKIIELATDNQQPLTVLLRQCIVLAYELKNEQLKSWANHELNGYGDSEEMPEYRIVNAPAVGTFSAGYYFPTVKRTIPSFEMEKEHRWAAETVRLAEPVSSYEDILHAEGTNLGFQWDSNLIHYYQSRFIERHALINAVQELPKSAIAGLLDTIRTRVLNMALEIRSEVGDKDEDLKKMTPEESKKVDQTITNNIFGGNVYVSGGNSTMTATTVQQQQQNIVAGDWKQLESVLKSAGITDHDLEELSAAVKSDGDQKLKESGSVMKWIKATAPKVLTGGVKMGAEVGKAVLTEMLMRHYGLK